MERQRKAARSRISSIRTKAELEAVLDASTLSPAQRRAVFLVFGCRMSRVAVAREMGVSLSFVNKAVACAYDKIG